MNPAVRQGCRRHCPACQAGPVFAVVGSSELNSASVRDKGIDPASAHGRVHESGNRDGPGRVLLFEAGKRLSIFESGDY